MTPSVAGPGRLARDPGSREHDILTHNLAVQRDKLRQALIVERDLPGLIRDLRFQVRDLELRLGLQPSYPPIGPDERNRTP